jgi:hypothetical protein
VRAHRLLPHAQQPPDYVLRDYLRAVKRVSALVPEAINSMDSPSRTGGIRTLEPVFHGDWELAMKYWSGELEPPAEPGQ